MELQVFNSTEFGSVRTTTVSGEVMFVGKDVAGIAYHAKHVCRYIFQKKIADSFFHDIYSVR